MIRILITLTFLVSQFANADYRVYQYILKNKLFTQQTATPLIRVSTLDPVSFVAYNGGAGSIKVDLVRTWRCPGNTSKKQICPSPYGELKLMEDSNVQN